MSAYCIGRELNYLFIVHKYVLYIEVTQRAPADIPDRRWTERRPEDNGDRGSICPDSLEGTKIKCPVPIRIPWRLSLLLTTRR